MRGGDQAAGIFHPYEQDTGGEGVALPYFLAFCYFFPVQLTTTSSGIGQRVNVVFSFFRVGNQQEAMR